MLTMILSVILYPRDERDRDRERKRGGGGGGEGGI